MINPDETGKDDWEAVYAKFQMKNYSEKKEEIFDYLTEAKVGKLIKKSEKNLKMELEDEYTEPEMDAKDSDRIGIYFGIGIMVIGVVIGGIIYVKKQKKE